MNNKTRFVDGDTGCFEGEVRGVESARVCS